MYDAVVLAECILEHGGRVPSLTNVPAVNLKKAVVLYEVDMFESGRDIICCSTKSEGMLSAENAAELLLRVIGGVNGA
jgi:hypothetical protein